MMKRLNILLIVLFILGLPGCTPDRTDITREEIVSAYQEAGYSVWTDVYDEKLDYGEIAYVQANHPSGDYIYFSFFETEQAAKAYKEEFYHPVMIGLFSVIFGDPSWPRWEVHGNIVVEFDEPEFYEVFEKLLRE